MYKQLFFFITLFLLFFTPKISLATETTPSIPSLIKQEMQFEALVLKVVKQESKVTFDTPHTYQQLKVEVINGINKGKEILIDSGTIPVAGTPLYVVGDRIVVHQTVFKDGKIQNIILDYVRRDALYVLLILFILVVLAVAGRKGMQAFSGLVVSYLILFYFVLPRIIDGQSPIIVSLIAGMLIIPVTFYLSHGWNKKTHVAIFGTLSSLAITLVIAIYFTHAAKLSGYSSEDVSFLQGVIKAKVDMTGIFLAGIIISLLGILDDVTISQASIVYQLKEVNKHLSSKELYLRAMDVGKDHIGSVINTLILVYTGTALPFLLLLVASNQDFQSTLNMEIIAEQFIQMLVASIGLILAVPITTYFAVLSKKS